jgi:hypothetical protein
MNKISNSSCLVKNFLKNDRKMSDFLQKYELSISKRSDFGKCTDPVIEKKIYIKFATLPIQENIKGKIAYFYNRFS